MANGSEAAGAPRVGIVGAGQLARMTQQAAIALGLDLRVLATAPDESAARVVRQVTLGLPDSLADLTAFAAGCDVLTFDHELVDVAQVQALEAAGQRVYPSAATVAVAQDKARQRALFAGLGLPVPAWSPVRDAAQIAAFAAAHGWPVVIKACRGGYDGRGVWVAADKAAADAVVTTATAAGLALLVEAWVPIDRELAVLVARRPGGAAVTYPVVESVQIDGICHEVLAPARLDAALTVEALRIAAAVAAAVAVTGILAVELFDVGGRLLINEIACRPHNSGHYSIEACVTSQFENHLRAVLDWPLGATEMVAPAAAMVNVIGGPRTPADLTRNLPAALAVAGVRVHLYGKASRPGRKIGHVTALGATIAAARARAARAAALLRDGASAEETGE